MKRLLRTTLSRAGWMFAGMVLAEYVTILQDERNWGSYEF